MTSEAPLHRQPPEAPHPGEADDVREFEGYRPTGDAVDQQAAAWLLRGHPGQGATQNAALGDWLEADPAHLAAYERNEAAWHEVGRLPADAVAALRSSLVVDHPPGARAKRPRSPARRDWLVRSAGLAFSLVIVAGIAWGVDDWWHSPVFTASYATKRGEMRTVSLPDGSRIQLDTDTRLDVVLYRQKRQVSLEGGRALFEVSHDANRPFDVAAGATKVTVVGTRFTVRRWPLDGGSAEVAVEQGRVRVAGTRTTLLDAGEVVASTSGGDLGALRRLDVAAMTGWQKGRLAFESRRLDQALAEFERYGDTHVRIDDPAVAALQINGSFDARKPGNFARIAARVLPIRIVQTPDGMLLTMANR